MPAKSGARVRFTCSACGAVSPKWQGRCDGCGEWNTLVEEVERPVAGRLRPTIAAPSAQPLQAVAADGGEHEPSGIGELDRVLGGGIVPGALILLGGDPGIGKSTLALQLAASLGGETPALYCAGEESAAQLAMRARRLDHAGAAIEVLAETDLDMVCAAIAGRRPALAVVDSVQTLFDTSIPGTPGSPSQVREAVNRLMVTAKSSGVPTVLVGHVTKEGAIAGPRTLEHMVDVVLYLEGERHGEHRILRGIKNRFGATGEVGLFVMTATGLAALEAPGRAFLDETSLEVPGNVLTVTSEGTRPLVVEVQALVTPTNFGLPRRTASGFDLGRLHLLLAVLEKRARVALAQSDVYLNVVGGVRLGEPAVDLAVALAVAGAARDRMLAPGTVVLGEIGLGGEIRRLARADARLREAAVLGMSAAVVPAAGTLTEPGLQLHRVATVGDAVRLLRG